jgi:hypothetical protein
MRIWHEKLIPGLCQKHLCAVWREGLGCYKIITEGKRGYRNHPAVKEFEFALDSLYARLSLIRKEMLRRGYRPKPLPERYHNTIDVVLEWQDLEMQIGILKAKGCKCKLEC